MYDALSTGILFGHRLSYLPLSSPLQKTRCPTKMIEDACAIILVQAVVCVAAEILHEEESSVSSRVGRITVGCVRHSVHEVYPVLATPIFYVHITLKRSRCACLISLFSMSASMSQRIGSFPTHFLLNNANTAAFSASALADSPIRSSIAVSKNGCRWYAGGGGVVASFFGNGRW